MSVTGRCPTGSGPLIVGRGPVRTGVTVILPPDDVWTAPVFAAAHRLNGNGEMTGLEWVRESGMLTSPVALTNTHSVGVVRDALLADRLTRPESALPSPWALPVVAETWDGMLNDLNGFHVRTEHVHEAIAVAESDAVAEGGVGAGTGMICHGFKGGIGTASRVCGAPGAHTVGVLVLANHGRRERLTVNGVAVASSLADIPVPADPDAAGPGAGSIIVIVATDAPLLPHQCSRLAQRAGLGIARTGGVGEHSSGDLFLCFATGNRGMTPGALADPGTATFALSMLADAHITATVRRRRRGYRGGHRQRAGGGGDDGRTGRDRRPRAERRAFGSGARRLRGRGLTWPAASADRVGPAAHRRSPSCLATSGRMTTRATPS